ncbi:MAG: STAS/SEC14 domain-containing protein [Verrucomicrobia bacterium]|nr:STAS/SEC14 domain-containing protein [Verrucomicrobiota bacterium]
MSAEIVDRTEGVLTVKITGKLTQPELAAVQKQAGEILKQQGRGRILVLIENFTGTVKAGDWGDISFQAQYDRLIEKIAFVGEKKWEDIVLLFTGKGVRRVPIEYFKPDDLTKAKAWLTA